MTLCQTDRMHNELSLAVRKTLKGGVSLRLPIRPFFQKGLSQNSGRGLLDSKVEKTAEAKIQQCAMLAKKKGRDGPGIMQTTMHSGPVCTMHTGI